MANKVDALSGEYFPGINGHQIVDALSGLPIKDGRLLYAFDIKNRVEDKFPQLKGDIKIGLQEETNFVPSIALAALKAGGVIEVEGYIKDKNCWVVKKSDKT